MIDEKKLIEKIEKQIDLNTKRYIDNISDEYSMILDEKIALLKWMINLIKSQPKINEWIPVEERLPEDGQVVLTSKGRCISILRFNEKQKIWEETKGNWWWNLIMVDAWIPLPKLYRKED